MNPQILNAMRELHSRVNDGIHVRLLWAEHDDRVVAASRGIQLRSDAPIPAASFG